MTTFLYLLASISDPGYTQKDKIIKINELLEITEDVNEICPFCEVLQYKL